MRRILLVGEFSGVHTDLATALRKSGHYVVTANSGDGFKNYKRDIDLNIVGRFKAGRIFEIIRKYYLFYMVAKKGRFDVIQFINPGLFPPYVGNILFPLLFKLPSKFILLACGGDTLVWQTYKKRRYKYYPYDGLVPEELERKRAFYESPLLIKLSDYVYNKVDTIIATMAEYREAHVRHEEKVVFIPLSIDCSQIKNEIAKKENDQITIYHPVSKGREREKGSDIILTALKKIEQQYPEEVKVVITESIPFDKYKSYLLQADIVIDQTRCYSPSMNAMYAMCMGKVVLGGGEQEYLDQMGITSAPIINILPNTDDIYNKLVRLISEKNKLSEMGVASSIFINEYHSYTVTIPRFEEVWSRKKITNLKC